MSAAIRTALPISHPGDVFRSRFLTRHSITVTDAAQKLHMQRSQLSRFVNGRTPVSLQLALKLEVATGVSAKYWLMRQIDFDLQQLKIKGTQLIEADLLLD